MAFIQVSTENPLGNRPLNLMARQQSLGWFSLGAAPTPGDYDNNQAVLGQLVAMGAISQDDANNIWSGNASLDDMAVNMTMINQALALTGQMGAQTVQPLPPSTSTPLPVSTAPAPVLTVVPYTPLPASAPAASAAPVTAAVGVPAGSTLSYTASWNNPSALAAGVLPKLTSQLPGYGLAVVNSAVTGQGLLGASSIQLLVASQGAHAQVADVASIINSLLQQLVGNTFTATPQASLVLAGGTPGLTTPAAAPSVTAFLENNAMMLAFLALGIVVLPSLIKKL